MLFVKNSSQDKFKTRSQVSVNKHNPTCEMCYCGMRYPITTDMAH